MLLTGAQRDQLEADGYDANAITSNLGRVLRENHARVLDFFRKIDTNFDGAISKGEMAYALHSLGLNASPKEVDALFMSFDPSGDGVIEFSELQHALVHGVSAGTARPKKLTKAQRERLRQENCNHTWEFEEMVHAFERSRGLDDPAAKPPPSASEMMKDDRLARLQEKARKARSGETAARDIRGELMSRMDAVWIKPPLLRPQTAPARQSAAAAAARRKAALYDYWLLKHRDEIEAHSRVVEREYAEEKRIRKERVTTRRNAQLDMMRTKQQASKLAALERHEPFPMRKEIFAHKQNFINRQRERAWGQEIVFLPPAVAAREAAVMRERRAPDYTAGVHAVLDLE